MIVVVVGASSSDCDFLANFGLFRVKMWKVLFILTVLTATCEPYSKKPKTTPGRNQRIIKVQGPPYFNHFHGHQKPLRKRPFGSHPGDEFIRPKYPPPIPPFFGGPSTNHIKHLPRPPPHVFHKSPSYGLGFPYKSFTSYRSTISKDKFRIHNISSLPARPSSSSTSVSSSTTYHSPTFTTSSSSFASSPVSHIISSDDNNGPIREIPAPNLAPKPHENSFGSISVVNDVTGIGGIGGVSGIGGIGGIAGVEGLSGIGGVKIHEIDIGGISGVLHGVGSDGVHGLSEISAGESVHGVAETGNTGDISSVASVGGITHLEPEVLLHAVAKSPNGLNLDEVVKNQGLEINTYIKESGEDVAYGKGPTVEIANFDEGSSIDVTNLIKDAAGMSDHHSGYEVTEHHNHLPSNDQIIKGHDGTKLYYAPDPDPSLPVHKVPPTNDPHSTPSNGQTTNSVYIPQISNGFPYLQGSSVGASLSPQELFHLMHGYPTVISQPIVAFVGQPQAPGVVLSAPEHSYFQQNAESYAGGDHYSQREQERNDIRQYLQRPEIHNLLHNSDDSQYEQENIGDSHSSVVRQSVYSPQNQYQDHLQSQYQTLSKDSSLKTFKTGNYVSTESNHNHQHEPEASESELRNSLTFIRETNEGSLSSETVKELLLEDSAANKLSQQENKENVPTILQLKNIPEVPFYASLPSKKAAEALAGLQAAGSIASNYMKKIKALKEDQVEERERKFPKDEYSWNDNDRGEGELLKGKREQTVVDIQKSVPLYETSVSSKNLLESDNDEEDNVSETEFYSQEYEGRGKNEFSEFDFQEEGSGNKTFGKRIRPK